MVFGIGKKKNSAPDMELPKIVINMPGDAAGGRSSRGRSHHGRHHRHRKGKGEGPGDFTREMPITVEVQPPPKQPVESKSVAKARIKAEERLALAKVKAEAEARAAEARAAKARAAQARAQAQAQAHAQARAQAQAQQAAARAKARAKAKREEESALEALKSRFTGSVSSAALRRNYRRRRNHYKNMTDDEIVDDFMGHFKFFLKEDARIRGDAAHPGKYLLDLSKLGYCGITIFYGQIPEGKEHILIPLMQAQLVKHFRLSSFKGFGLHFSKKHRLSEITTVRISWYQPTENDVAPKTHPSTMKDAHPEDTSEDSSEDTSEDGSETESDTDPDADAMNKNKNARLSKTQIIKEQSDLIKNMKWFLDLVKNPSGLLEDNEEGKIEEKAEDTQKAAANGNDGESQSESKSESESESQSASVSKESSTDPDADTESGEESKTEPDEGDAANPNPKPSTKAPSPPSSKPLTHHKVRSETLLEILNRK